MFLALSPRGPGRPCTHIAAENVRFGSLADNPSWLRIRLCPLLSRSEQTWGRLFCPLSTRGASAKDGFGSKIGSKFCCFLPFFDCQTIRRHRNLSALPMLSLTTRPHIQMYAGYAVHRQVPRKGIGARLRRGQCSKVLEFGEHKAHAATRDARPVTPGLNVCGRDRASLGGDLGLDIFEDGQRLRRGKTSTSDFRRVPA